MSLYPRIWAFASWLSECVCVSRSSSIFPRFICMFICCLLIMRSERGQQQGKISYCECYQVSSEGSDSERTRATINAKQEKHIWSNVIWRKQDFVQMRTNKQKKPTPNIFILQSLDERAGIPVELHNGPVKSHIKVRFRCLGPVFRALRSRTMAGFWHSDTFKSCLQNVACCKRDFNTCCMEKGNMVNNETSALCLCLPGQL